MTSRDLSWICDLHRLTTTGDCPRCDDQAIAALEQTNKPTCQACSRPLNDGETAWAEDVKAVDLATGAVTMRTRYTCDDCAAVNA